MKLINDRSNVLNVEKSSPRLSLIKEEEDLLSFRMCSGDYSGDHHLLPFLVNEFMHENYGS